MNSIATTERAGGRSLCPRCRTKFPADDGEYCAACLFHVALESNDPARWIGEYELLQELGEGGMGRVYLAKHVDDERLVALKLAKPEVLQTPEGARAFRRERTAGRLRHPHIVNIEATGTHEGQPYIVMQLLEGGTLADPEVRAAHATPERALQLMLRVTRAVQFAHDHLILHCDLKAANILFDASNCPFVSDFGLSHFIGRGNSTHAGGSPGWMSPEQAHKMPLTTASDVFSLGVLLHWVLEGELPDRGEDRQDPALRAAGQVRGLRRDLAAIAQKAMQRAPEGRFRSAAEMADDLERARDLHPIWDERDDRPRRAMKWVRRHRLAAAAGLQLLLLLLYALVVPISVLREVKSTIREQNAFSAVAQAGAVMNELRLLAGRVEDFARDPRMRRILERSDSHALAHPDFTTNFDALSVIRSDGVVRAGWPLKDRIGHNRSYRDYFRGQRALAASGKRGIYVSRALRSTGDRDLMIALSAPVYTPTGEYLGAVTASIKARSTFGAVQMSCTAGGGCFTALLGARDRDTPEGQVPSSLSILAAPGIARGEERTLAVELSQEICKRVGCEPGVEDPFTLATRGSVLVVDDYQDPVSGGQAIAAMAPVGRTGLVALVATPNSAAQVKAFLWVPFALGLLLLLALSAGPGVRFLWRGIHGPIGGG